MRPVTSGNFCRFNNVTIGLYHHVLEIHASCMFLEFAQGHAVCIDNVSVKSPGPVSGAIPSCHVFVYVPASERVLVDRNDVAAVNRRRQARELARLG